jgi:hypothetical protein
MKANVVSGSVSPASRTTGGDTPLVAPVHLTVTEKPSTRTLCGEPPVLVLEGCDVEPHPARKPAAISTQAATVMIGRRCLREAPATGEKYAFVQLGTAPSIAVKCS